MKRPPPRSTLTHSFPTQRSSDLLRRILLELPEGRRHAGIGGLEPHELDDVLGADAAVGVEGHRAVGIEADVGAEIGSASCRERVCQYVWISGVAVSLKKKKYE